MIVTRQATATALALVFLFNVLEVFKLHLLLGFMRKLFYAFHTFSLGIINSEWLTYYFTLQTMMLSHYIVLLTCCFIYALYNILVADTYCVMLVTVLIDVL